MGYWMDGLMDAWMDGLECMDGLSWMKAKNFKTTFKSFLCLSQIAKITTWN